MNVTFIRLDNPFSASSASANRYRTLMEGLVGLGVRVKLVITDGYQSKTEKNKFKNKRSINGIIYYYLFPFLIKNFFLSRINLYVYNFLFAPLKAIKIRKLLENEISGTILWPSIDISQLIAIKIKRSKFLYFIESNEYPDIVKYEKSNLLQKVKVGFEERYFEKNIFCKLDGMALMTNSLIQYYSKLSKCSPKFLHLPMTVDLDRFNIDKKTVSDKILKKPYIAFVGIMSNSKEGIDILIDAFSKITLKYPELNLYLFGFRHYDSSGHEKQIKKLNLSSKVFYHGPVNRGKIPSILMNAKLLVLPRPNSHQARGGFPTKLGEYLASRVPVVATRVGELPNYLIDGESVFFAEPGSVESLANTIMRALSNKRLSNKVAHNGRMVAEKYFNKEIQARILYDFLKKLQGSEN